MTAAADTIRIVVTGSECTGKTTLARQLAAYFQVPVVGEFARRYAHEQGRPLTVHDVEPIARGQIASEDEAEAGLAASSEDRGPPLLILDTDLVSTVVYATHYYGSCPAWITDTARRRLGQLYLLSDLDIPWSADGVRDRPHARGEIQGLFQDELMRLGARIHRISGLGAARLQHALRSIAGSLPGVLPPATGYGRTAFP